MLQERLDEDSWECLTFTEWRVIEVDAAMWAMNSEDVVMKSLRCCWVLSALRKDCETIVEVNWGETAEKCSGTENANLCRMTHFTISFSLQKYSPEIHNNLFSRKCFSCAKISFDDNPNRCIIYLEGVFFRLIFLPLMKRILWHSARVTFHNGLISPPSLDKLQREITMNDSSSRHNLFFSVFFLRFFFSPPFEINFAIRIVSLQLY